MMSDMPAAGIDRPERSGSPGLVLILAILLVVVVVAFSVLPRDEAQRLILAFLALLAVVGVFALFALGVGFIQFAGQGSRNDLTKLLADTSAEGLLVTEGESQPIYANDAYMALSGARDAADLRLVDRLFSGTAEVSEAIYRLALAAREGKRCTEELRISPSLVGDGPVAW
jgi:two-component system cell cycle sensor histidine kinase/response regulator CckA